MAATLFAAAVTCIGALFLGQAALRLSGAKEWNWLAPMVGISIGMLFATPTNHIPGRALTMAILLGLLIVAAMFWCLTSPAHTPPGKDLLAAAPVAALLMVPFLAVDRAGILGTGLNNDMSVHLLFAEGFISESATFTRALPLDYPLGPHATAALLTKGLGIEAQQGFTGWTLAIPILTAWTSLAVARKATWIAKLIIATVVGLPFLVAAYYGQGAFKEITQAGLVLAAALSLGGYGPRLDRGRWVPFALLAGGMVSVYSITGLPWPLIFLGIYVAGALIRFSLAHGLRELPRRVRAELAPVGIGIAVLVVALLPQADRIAHFISLRSSVNGTGIATGDLGNLVAPLSPWEAFGVWGNADFRFPDVSAIGGPIWTAAIVALVVIGAIWAVRRKHWLLPAAAFMGMAIWWISNHSQSPYVSAKGLVIASPLLLLIAVLPLSDRISGTFWRWAGAVVGIALVFAVGASDLRALKISPVGPVGHAHELESFRPTLAGKRVLFLGDDDFVDWELAGAKVVPVIFGGLGHIPTRPQKKWEPGQPLDFDSVTAAVLNDFEWVLTTRDAAASEPPPQFHLVRSTANFELWKRTGDVQEVSLLQEGGMPGAILDCSKPAGRALAAAPGIAAIRTPPVVETVENVGAEQTASVAIKLPSAGEWQLETPYISSLPLIVRGPGLDATLPANLDRQGPRWPIGSIRTSGPETVTLELEVEGATLAPPNSGAILGAIVATKVGSDRIVPLARACGKYVDWYRRESSHP
ncbi:MAG: hypothetical protein JSU06_08300 [Actinobacteria bacterium]|nr:hypothetical protein [Actinomycetota bacterium]